MLSSVKQISLAAIGAALLCGTIAQAQNGPQCQSGCAASYTISSPNPSYVYNAGCATGPNWDYGVTVSVNGTANGVCRFRHDPPGGCAGACTFQVAATYALVGACGGQVYLNPIVCGASSGPFALASCGSPGAECFLWSGLASADCGGACAVNIILNEPQPGTSTSVVATLTCAACP